MVGVKYSQEFIKKENWYLQHSWNEQQEKEFRAWFIKNIKKDLKISNRKAELEYTWFNLTYGWTGK